MKRLTGKDECGYYAPRDVTLNCLKQRGELIDRLAAYEDTGQAPEDVQSDMMKWISVDDMLPENEQVVLVLWENPQVANNQCSVMMFIKGRTRDEVKLLGHDSPADEWEGNKKPYRWYSPDFPVDLWGQEVHHWMPLPKPPEIKKV